MKVLHTSDWHIGANLYGKKRYEEFEAFLAWLGGTIQQHQADVLLIAGDIFDTGSPTNRAQELYYRFLCRVAASPCRHVVVIAGNHDSPSFLNAPKELLRALDIHVVGTVCENLEEEVIVLSNQQGFPELIVCAVPYLRDKDVRLAEAGESSEDKGRKLMEGISNHYAAVAALAAQKRAQLGENIPIIGMGHLFTAGGQTVAGDGVRELYVGSLAHVHAGIFPEIFDYLALGHLHVPQKVRSSREIRYSGSPLPMGFGEAKQQKSVCLVDFQSTSPSVGLIAVPSFQRLERVQGNWEVISNRICALAATSAQPPPWLEVIYEGNEIIGNLRELVDKALSDSKMECLCVKNTQIMDQVLKQIHVNETLDDLNDYQVFERLLANHKIPEEQWAGLLDAYKETVARLYEADTKSE